jgi:hypothetical protein
MLKSIVRFARRVVTVVAVLALFAGNASVCDGWQATPEARMACCMSAPNCPMHDSNDHGRSVAHIPSQEQADDCCAVAPNRTQSSGANSPFALASVTALPAVVVSVVPVVVPALQQWRALVPLRSSPVPKHLLLSVLLV